MTCNLIVNNTLATSTQKTYRKSLAVYQQFLWDTEKEKLKFPLNLKSFMNFITFLHVSGYAFNTILTYVSALSFYSKLSNCPDISKNFLVQKQITAIKRKGVAADSRMPITHEHIRSLIDNIQLSNHTEFIKKMKKAMYLLAFCAFLRVGEFTLIKQNECKRIINLEDIRFYKDQSKKWFVELKIVEYKSHYNENPVIIMISEGDNKRYCCVQILADYVNVRGNKPGPLFKFQDGITVSRRFFTDQLKQDVMRLGLNDKKYKSHSFRIGAATSASLNGISEEQIKRLGRWHSNSFKRYIRIPKSLSNFN